MAFASTANAGISIPAGDWTLDVSGNVNTYATWTDADKVKGNGVNGGIATGRDKDGQDTTQSINTGLLPAWLGFSGKTRQNDLDVAFTISMQPSVSDNGATGDLNSNLGGYGSTLWRQAFLTFGDASWGQVKMGKDLGIFAGQAILNDMTLLGVGAGAGNSGAATTLGGIGAGYIYPAWKGQISYQSPNWNGFQFTVGITNPNQNFGRTMLNKNTSNETEYDLYQDRFGYEGQVMYSWTGDVAGKVWASAASYDVTAGTQASTATALVTDSYRANAWDIGANVNVAGFGITGYYYDGKGAGTTFMGSQGADIQGGKFKRRDSDGGYVQVTYVLPTQTKLGVSYGVSNLDKANGSDSALTSSADGDLLDKNKRWTLGAYHPLTKSLNLVAEYNDVKSEAHTASKQESKSVSLGAILFF